MINNKNTGVIAYGVKTGIITPKDKIVEIIKTTFKKNPELLKNEDILCVKEAVVAITQNNFVNLSDISKDINNKLKLKNSKIGVLFPITSRNRFSLILQAIASSVPNGKVIVQLSFPADEQGNQIISEDFLRKKKLKSEDKITLQMIGKNRFLHPETGMDYIKFYEDILLRKKEQKQKFFCPITQKILLNQKLMG